MRAVWTALLLALAGAAAAAETRGYNAGVARLLVEDGDPFSVLVWYPTEAAEAAWQSGPFPIEATRDAPPARGARFPVVLLSHGGGAGGGSPLVHRALARSLARAGFIVVAPFHPAEGPRLAIRPRQVRAALAAVLADSRFAARAEAGRVAMIGFSLGATVTLIAAGGVPNLALLADYCRDHADDRRACRDDSGSPGREGAPGVAPPRGMPLKAIVLLEPFAALFDREGLAAVTMPALIYRARESDLKAEGNALALARNLPKPPREETVPGGHFVFVDPCPPPLAAGADEVCRDAPGVDRAEIQRRIAGEIAVFLRGNL